MSILPTSDTNTLTILDIAMRVQYLQYVSIFTLVMLMGGSPISGTPIHGGFAYIRDTHSKVRAFGTKLDTQCTLVSTIQHMHIYTPIISPDLYSSISSIAILTD